MKTLKLLLAALLLSVAFGVVGAAVLIHRGFSATQVPSFLEATLARRVRNLAIPGLASRRKNPFAASSEASRQGREYFFNQCAACHGSDGSGRTQLGMNFYPRVPDLRGAATQSLTDGEISYIIENGVQLTGMPALGTSSTGSSGASWKLVLFIRSLRPLTDGEKSDQAAAGVHGQYVGSQACQTCHRQIYERWKKTPMANVVRDLKSHPEAIIPNLATNTVSKFTGEQVALVYGSLWKQRFFTKINDDFYPLPAQWDISNHAWRPYMVPLKGGDWWGALYPPDNMQRPTSATCDGCHSVDYNIQTKQPVEWNVGCERCHGPGSEHVAHPTRSNILNPAQLDSVKANDTCIQCHSQGQPLTNPIAGKYYDWPVGYNVGLKLKDFWKLEDCTLGRTDFYYFPDCTAHKNRMQGNDFVQSLMYQHGMTCFSCHDAHGTQNYAQLRKPARELCLDCHGPSSPNGPYTATIEEHTHHRAGSRGSECVACHMPPIETEGVPGAFVHAHTFRFVTPSMTAKYNIPNPCTSCHKDKSANWAENALSEWPEHSPWKAKL